MELLLLLLLLGYYGDACDLAIVFDVRSMQELWAIDPVLVTFLSCNHYGRWHWALTHRHSMAI